MIDALIVDNLVDGCIFSWMFPANAQRLSSVPHSRVYKVGVKLPNLASTCPKHYVNEFLFTPMDSTVDKAATHRCAMPDSGSTSQSRSLLNLKLRLRKGSSGRISN